MTYEDGFTESPMMLKNLRIPEEVAQVLHPKKKQRKILSDDDDEDSDSPDLSGSESGSGSGGSDSDSQVEELSPVPTPSDSHD